MSKMGLTGDGRTFVAFGEKTVEKPEPKQMATIVKRKLSIDEEVDNILKDDN